MTGKELVHALWMTTAAIIIAGIVVVGGISAYGHFRNQREAIENQRASIEMERSRLKLQETQAIQEEKTNRTKERSDAIQRLPFLRPKKDTDR